MQDWDEWVRVTLRTEVRVSRRQREQAWLALQARLAGQMMLSPVPEACQRSWRSDLLRWGHELIRLVADESAYRRTEGRVYTYRYRDASLEWWGMGYRPYPLAGYRK